MSWLWVNELSEWVKEWVSEWVSQSEWVHEWVECEGSRELSECTIQSVSARTSWFGIDVSHLVEIVWITLWSVNGETNLDNKLCRSMHTTTENETWHDYYKSIKLIFTSLRLPSTLKVWICQDIYNIFNQNILNHSRPVHLLKFRQFCSCITTRSNWGCSQWPWSISQCHRWPYWTFIILNFKSSTEHDQYLTMCKWQGVLFVERWTVCRLSMADISQFTWNFILESDGDFHVQSCLTLQIASSVSTQDLRSLPKCCSTYRLLQ